MSTPTPLLYQPPAVLKASGRRRWNTPRLLRAALAAVCASAIVLYLVVTLAVGQRRAAFKAVGEDSAPSILAAQRVRAYLADMDANAANELIAKPGANPDAVRDYDKRRADVNDALVSAAQNITYGQAERIPVVTLINGLGDYERAMTQARDSHARGEQSTMLGAYRNADDVLHKTLLPASVALDKVNSDALNTTYNRDRIGFTTTLFLTLLAGGLLLAALGMTQLFLSRRVHRTLNPGLLAGSVIVVLYMLHTFASFLSVNHHFKTAKEDAFDSVQALWSARATAFDANADESRWLLDRANAAEYAAAFASKSRDIAVLPPNLGYAAVADLYLKSQHAAGFEGDLAKELNNITFEGEKEAATDALHKWGEYIALDGEIRRLENAGQHDRAVALCTGNDPGQSNYAYSQFDAALDKTLEINQKEFDASLQEARRLLHPFDALNFVVLALVIAAAFVGLLPRLREYAF